VFSICLIFHQKIRLGMLINVMHIKKNMYAVKQRLASELRNKKHCGCVQYMVERRYN